MKCNVEEQKKQDVQVSKEIATHAKYLLPIFKIIMSSRDQV